MAGELQHIGTRPRLVASFDPPGAAEGFRAWRAQNIKALERLPEQTLRVEYGRSPAGGLFVRVRIDEHDLPQGLEP